VRRLAGSLAGLTLVTLTSHSIFQNGSWLLRAVLAYARRLPYGCLCWSHRRDIRLSASAVTQLDCLCDIWIRHEPLSQLLDNGSYEILR
jgi:hypothetical protein